MAMRMSIVISEPSNSCRYGIVPASGQDSRPKYIWRGTGMFPIEVVKTVAHRLGLRLKLTGCC